MSKPISCITFLATIAVTALAVAQDDPRHARHELMEGVGDAARPVGRMLRGDAEFDAGVAMSSIQTFVDAAGSFGDLFPEGSETGEETRAAPAIWEDRAGFEKALADFGAAADAALAASPGTLDEARPALGPVFQACRSCHETYRLEEEE
jgi:cytochrome c556